MIRKLVLSEANASVVHITRLMNEIHASANSISIPENFAFLKFLSDRYADKLRRYF